MQTPNRFAARCRDLSSILVELEDAYRSAHSQARSPARRGDGTGTRQVGSYSDPTGHTAAQLADFLDATYAELAAMCRDARRMRGRMSEWLPDQSWPATSKRCGEADCARPHHARGLCKTHYQRLLRSRGEA